VNPYLCSRSWRLTTNYGIPTVLEKFDTINEDPIGGAPRTPAAPKQSSAEKASSVSDAASQPIPNVTASLGTDLRRMETAPTGNMISYIGCFVGPISGRGIKKTPENILQRPTSDYVLERTQEVQNASGNPNSRVPATSPTSDMSSIQR